MHLDSNNFTKPWKHLGSFGIPKEIGLETRRPTGVITNRIVWSELAEICLDGGPLSPGGDNGKNSTECISYKNGR